MTRRRDCLMTPHFPIWSFGPKIESVDGICHQTDSMNRFFLDVKTGSKHQIQKMGRAECGNYYRSILLVAHASKILLKIIARRPQRALRARGDPAGGTEWFPTEPFYHRYDVCDSSATGAGAEETNSVVCMVYRPY